MHTARAAATLLEVQRLDPEYYHPQYLADDQSVREFGSTSLGSVGKFFAGPFGSELPSRLYLDEGVPLFRVGNVGSMQVVPNNMAHLAPEVHHELKASEVLPGDLLVVKASVSEKICKVPEWIPRANITQHILAIRTNGKLDVDFLAAFLFSKYGRSQLIRRSLGSIIQYLGITDAKTVLYPVVSPETQKYIGDQLRHAEKLREYSNRIDAAAERALALALGATSEKWIAGCNPVGMWPTGGFSTRVSCGEIRGRIDPAGYHPELRAIGSRARSLTGLFKRLPDVASVVTSSRKRIPSGAACAGCISILHVDDRGVVDMTGAAAHRPESDGRLCLTGDVLLSGINPAANRVGVCSDIVGDVACSPEFSILVPIEGIHPHYLAFALRSKPCLRQLIHLGQGTSSSRRRIEESELDNLWVPLIENNDQIGASLAKAQLYRLFSAKLTESAKVLVEQLVDRHITDDQLGNAQTAIIRGDRSLDRAILSRLTEDTKDDSLKPPLFADLDALYAAIDEAQRTQPSNGDAA